MRNVKEIWNSTAKVLYFPSNQSDSESVRSLSINGDIGLPHETAYVANTLMTLAHKIDGLLSISKIQNSLEKVLIGSEIMYRKVSEFEIQIKH